MHSNSNFFLRILQKKYIILVLVQNWQIWQEMPLPLKKESQWYYIKMYNNLPPVPSPLVKSPPWIMKSGITLWNLEPLYPSPSGFWANWKKLSAVLGTVLPKRPMVTRPAGSSPIEISNQTLWVTCNRNFIRNRHKNR